MATVRVHDASLHTNVGVIYQISIVKIILYYTEFCFPIDDCFFFVSFLQRQQKMHEISSLHGTLQSFRIYWRRQS